MSVNTGPMDVHLLHQLVCNNWTPLPQPGGRVSLPGGQDGSLSRNKRGERFSRGGG